MLEDDSRNGDEDDAASQDEEDGGRDSDFSLADLPVLLLFQFKKKTVTIRRIKLSKLQFKVHNVAQAKRTYSEDLLHSQNALHKDGSQLVSDSRQQKPE